MLLEIITPDKELYKGKVNSVTVPGSKGSFEILKNHAPIISTLEAGKIKIVDKDNKEIYVELSGGAIEVENNKLTILATLG